MTSKHTEEVSLDMAGLVVAIAARWFRILLITALLLAATFVVLKFVPKQFESSSSILVESRDNFFTRATNDVSISSAATDIAAVSSQIELIKSRDTLLQVIDAEGLRDVAEFNGAKTSLLGAMLPFGGGAAAPNTSDEYVLNSVAENLRVIQQRDSRIISVSFRSIDPERAAKVANAVANTHVRRRAELSVNDTADATEWLLAEIQKLRTRVATAEAEVAAYRIDNDLFVGTNNTSLLDQQLSGISTQITAAQERKNTAKSRAALIRGLLDAGQPIEGVPDVRDSVVVQRLSESKAGLQGQRAQRLATLLASHPDIKALSAQIAEIDKQILVEGRRVADALDAEASIEAGIESSLRDELARLKIDVSGATRDSVILNELEREAKAQRDLLETYLLRYRAAAARTDASASLPDVRVVTAAAAALLPVSPRTSFILAAVAIVSLTLQVAQILFGELVSGRAFAEQREDRDVAIADGNDEPGFVAAQQSPTPPHQVPLANRGTPAVPGRRQGRDVLAEYIQSEGEQLVLVATIGDWIDSRATTEAITADLIEHRRSVAEIDAGSGQTTADLGLSDLCAGNAEFGDVVHRGKRSDFAIVPWGQEEAIDSGSPKCQTLVEALAQIFEVVLVDTGPIDHSSLMPTFSGLQALVILISDHDTDAVVIEQAYQSVSALGFSNIRVFDVDADQSKVA